MSSGSVSNEPMDFMYNLEAEVERLLLAQLIQIEKDISRLKYTHQQNAHCMESGSFLLLEKYVQERSMKDKLGQIQERNTRRAEMDARHRDEKQLLNHIPYKQSFQCENVLKHQQKERRRQLSARQIRDWQRLEKAILGKMSVYSQQKCQREKNWAQEWQELYPDADVDVVRIWLNQQLYLALLRSATS